MLNRFKVNSRSTVEQRRVKLSQTSSVAFVFSSAVVDNRQNCSRLVSALTRSVLTKAEQKQPRHPTSPWLPANTTWRHMSRYIPSSGCEGQLQFYRRSTAALPFHTNGCNYTKLMAGVCQGCCQERTHTHVKHMCARHINVPAVQCLQASGVKVANKWVLIGSFLRAALLVFYLHNPVGQKKALREELYLLWPVWVHSWAQKVTVASGFSGVCGRNHRKWNESSVHCRYLASVWGWIFVPDLTPGWLKMLVD